MKQKMIERKEAIKNYVKANRDFAFFCAGATSMVLGQMAVLRYIDTKRMVVEGDVIYNSDDDD
jgi:hypothetical protein